MAEANRDVAGGEGAVRFGDYVLEERIAVGGMSEVYLARAAEAPPNAPRIVIKRPLAAVLDDPERRAAFVDEARLHASARHANIVEVLDHGTIRGEPFLALEYVSGVDVQRLTKRAQVESRPIPAPVAVYVAREVAKALSCVHHLTDEHGVPLGVVHRNVTPSNVYLSAEGDVKLGDFGIARSIERTRKPGGNSALKGKYAYLAPEQVAGEPFDQRADIFSLAVVLCELLIGKPLFPGAGQLAVLLAIRDCRIEPLRAAAGMLPVGLMPVLQRALAKLPDDRYSSADELFQALSPWEKPSRSALRGELAKLVDWARDGSVSMTAIRPSASRVATAPAAPAPTPGATPPSSDDTAQTAPPTELLIPSVRTTTGQVLTELPFAKLVEMIATGQLCAADVVDRGDGKPLPLGDIEELARHLPPSTGATARYEGPGTPDFASDLTETPMLDALAWLGTRRETGAMFVSRNDDASALRKEIYLEAGKIVLVSSSDASEMLGEYLVRRGAIDRSDLEMALLVMPKYGGRLGNTLIALGLVDAVQIFRAIRAQGRDRVVDLFRWSNGFVTFYRGVRPPKVDFPLDLDVAQVMLSGLEAIRADELAELRFQDELQETWAPIRPPPPFAPSVAWPNAVLHVVNALGHGKRLADAVDAVTAARSISRGDVLRAFELALAMGIVQRV